MLEQRENTRDDKKLVSRFLFFQDQLCERQLLYPEGERKLVEIDAGRIELLFMNLNGSNKWILFLLNLPLKLPTGVEMPCSEIIYKFIFSLSH